VARPQTRAASGDRDHRPDHRVGVVMITRDRCREADLALRRLAALPERPHVVVVDNGSVDGTAEHVRTHHPDVTLLTPGENLGGYGRNLGVAELDTPYVAFCDDDTWYEPGALTTAADLLDRHADLAVVTARIMVEPGARLDPISEEMSRSPLRRPPGAPGHPLLSFLAGVSVVRRAAFLEAGGFSRRMWLGGEEELLGCDLASRGWQLSYVPDVVAHHQASVLRDPHRRRADGIRNTLWFTWLRRPVPSALRRSAQLLRSLPRDPVSLRGVLAALAGAPWVWRARQVVPAEVEAGYRLLDDMLTHSEARRYVS